jgi:GNAT superfamily N-acetyltransferase
MQPILRKATPSDAARVAEIYLISRKQYLSYAPLVHTDDAVRSWVRDRLIPDGNVTVVQVEEALLGFLATSKDDSFSWIDHLYLAPEAVGIGLGSRLVREAQLLLGSPIRLYTFQANAGARRFYQRHGFEEIEYSDGASNEEQTPDVLMEWHS